MRSMRLLKRSFFKAKRIQEQIAGTKESGRETHSGGHVTPPFLTDAVIELQSNIDLQVSLV
ncbi:MAG: hypothetical protein DSY43_06180 [Gammaproteobacteria bacterium]|nr:MAG: hypothetical protein DSY43_06180 [Gammaproteobacteria bacterium]